MDYFKRCRSGVQGRGFPECKDSIAMVIEFGDHRMEVCRGVGRKEIEKVGGWIYALLPITLQGKSRIRITTDLQDMMQKGVKILFTGYSQLFQLIALGIIPTQTMPHLMKQQKIG